MSSVDSVELCDAQSSTSAEDSNTSTRSAAKASWKACLREAFRIDFKPRSPVTESLARLRHEDEEAGACNNLNRPLGFGNSITALEIKEQYANTHLQEKWKEAVLVLKLSLSLMSYGQTSVDAQLNLLKVCENLQLPSPRIEIGTTYVQASFGACHGHHVQFNEDIVTDKLLDATALSIHMASEGANVGAALRVLDEIIDRPLPYGTAFKLLNLQCLLSWSAIAAFMGDFQDMAAAALIAPFVILIVQLSKRWNLGNIESVLAAVMVGVVTPVVWRYIVPLPICHVPRLWASALLIFLPGTELINGSYEIKYGNLNNGAAKLVGALARCAFLGGGLTLGWQVFGHNAAMTEVGGAHGVKASLVPSEVCAGTGIRWEIIFTVINFPMLFHCFASLNMRIADIWKAFVVVYPSLIAFMALVMQGPFPSFVNDILGLFIATNLACFMEYKTGTPVNVSVIPMIIILAPGAPSVMSILGSMQKGYVANNSMQSFWNNLALQGVSYAIGLCLALELWRPLVHRKNQVRARAVVETYGW